MRAKNYKSSGGFTLLELVIVLAILAVVTALATREIGYVQDQQRFEVSQHGLGNIQAAILGTPDDRMPEGTPSSAGFLTDMGRLPRTVGSADLTLAELWANPGMSFDVRPAVGSNGVSATQEDPQVLVSGGWRGPYVRLFLGADTLKDGWGNPYKSPSDASPADPDGTGYARLRDADDAPLTAAGQEIRIIRHLGANGHRSDTDTGYDRDIAIAFPDSAIYAGIKGQVEVLSGSSPAVPDPSDTVSIRAFGPDPADPSRIKVWGVTVSFASNPVTWEIPVSAGLTVGPRVVRAYFADANGSGTTAYRKSAVRHLTLRAGFNPLDLTIDR
jgi:prepilin-type N-terminal cleavage/methylation domain-containing protein